MKLGFLLTNVAALTETWTSAHLAHAALEAGHEVRLFEPWSHEVTEHGRLVARAWALAGPSGSRAELIRKIRRGALPRRYVGLASLDRLFLRVNPLTAALTFVSLIGYAVIYTVYLKRATPQNIVIGGAAGAAPPVLGWTAVTNDVSAFPLILFLIIFAWTPPHFWALAIARKEEYAKVDIPMLPVTHGEAHTINCILAYTVLLVAVSILPSLLGMSGIPYLVGAVLLGIGFLYYAVALKLSERQDLPMRTFGYSITYLGGLFVAMAVDVLVREGL